MTDLPSIKAYRIGSFSGHPFKAYRYNGDAPVAAEPPKTRQDAPECEEVGCTARAHAVGLCPSHYYAYKKAIKADPSLRKPRAVAVFTPDKCGTNAGYQRHAYHKQDPCRRCKEAHNIARNERKIAAKARKEGSR